MGNSEDLKRVWDNCLSVIRDNISHDAFKTWFMPIKPVKLDGAKLTIQLPSHFFVEFLDDMYFDLMKSTIKKELGSKGELFYSVVVVQSNRGNTSTQIPTKDRGIVKNPPVSLPIAVGHDGGSKDLPNPFIIPGLKNVQINSQLNGNYTLSNFIEGDCNRLGRNVGISIAANPGKTAFNPLYIYSPSGMGKTHLSHAIGLEIRKKFPSNTVLYVTCEQFMRQYTSAARDKSINDFVHFYQMVDVLIVDDIQFLSGKKGTQEVFFHLFEYLYQSNKQIILTSDKPSGDIKDVETRLLSRFKWGLDIELTLPDVETRAAILRNKAYNDGIMLLDDVVDYCANAISTNVRELEGVYYTMLAHASSTKRNIDIDLARSIINKRISNNAKEITVEDVFKIVCDHFKVNFELVKSNTRKREVAQARHLCMYFAKMHTKATLVNIGMLCGNKNHATVLHALRSVNNMMETDKNFKYCVEELERRLKR